MTPAQKSAYNQVRAAFHGGLLSRPDKCEHCGLPETFGTDGRSLLHGHHEDYEKPLEVVFLCTRCHRKVTRMARGERSGNSVLRTGLIEAAAILRREGFTVEDIAAFYVVSRAGLSHALRGYRWKHLGLAERDK